MEIVIVPVPKGPLTMLVPLSTVLAPCTSTVPPRLCSVNPPLKVFPALLMTSVPLP